MTEPGLPVPLHLRPRRLRRILAAGIVLLVAGHLATQAAKHLYGRDYLQGLVPLFDLDRESNLPTAFSVFQLLLTSAAAAVVASRARRARDPFAGRWKALAIIFLYIAVDEAAEIHELLSPPMRSLLGSRATGALFAPWVIPVGILTALLGLWFLTFLRSLDRRARALSILAGALFLGGALGMEMLGHAYASGHGKQNALYSMGFVTVEETMEMTGIWVFLGVCLDRIAAHGEDVHVRVSDDA